MAGQFNIDSDLLKGNKALAAKVVDNAGEIDKLKAQNGALGSIWGSSENIPKVMASVLIIGLLTSGIVYSFQKMNVPADDKTLSIKDFWSIIAPLITLAIGYLFGDKKNSSS